MSIYDAETGWTHNKGMMVCLCTHLEKSHRPMSRKCSLCDCLGFKFQAAPVLKKK